MKFLRFIAGLLTVGVITNVAGAWVFDATLLNSSYITSQARSSGAYDQFSEGFPKALKQSPDKNTRKSASLIEAVVTPKYTESKLTSYITQLEQYYRNDGPRPKVDFTDLAKIAKRDGFEIPPSALKEPVQLGVPIDSKNTNLVFNNLGLIKFGGAVLAMALLSLMYFLGKEGKKLRSVGSALLGSGIGLLPNVAVFSILPSVAAGLIKDSKEIGPLAPALTSLLEAVFQGVAKQFLLWAIALGALAVGVYIIHFVTKLGHKSKDKPRSKKDRDEGGLIPQP